MHKVIMISLLAFTTLFFSACGGGDSGSTSSSPSQGINSTPITSISVVILDNNNTNGRGTTYSVYGLSSVTNPYDGNYSSGTLLGSSDVNATFTSTSPIAHNYYAIVTNSNNRVYLDSVKGSNGKYYIPYTTSEVAFIGSNVDVTITSTGVSHNYGNKPDTNGTSIGKVIAGSYQGGSLILDYRGFNIVQ